MLDRDVSAEFQRRRGHTWKTTRWWMLVALIGGISFACGPQGSTLQITQNRFTYQLVCLVVVFTAFVVVILRVTKHYRCPMCNAMPMRRMGGGGTFSYKTGVDLNPSVCPKCDARLRADE